MQLNEHLLPDDDEMIDLAQVASIMKEEEEVMFYLRKKNFIRVTNRLTMRRLLKIRKKIIQYIMQVVIKQS